MMFKLLPVFLFLTLCSAKAINFTSPADANNSLVATEKADDLRHLSVPKFTGLRMPAYRRGGSQTNVYFFYSVDLGYSSVTATGPTHFTKGGFMYGGEFGAKIFMASRNDGHAGMIGISVSLTNADANKLKFGLIGVPVTYTFIKYSRNEDGLGVFAQGGGIVNFVHDVHDNNDNDVTKHFNGTIIEPYVSLGFHAPFEIRRRRDGGRVGGGRVFFGPFFSYAFANMSKDPGENITGYKLGIKYAYVFF
jgi:hypothetical protein